MLTPIIVIVLHEDLPLSLPIKMVGSSGRGPIYIYGHEDLPRELPIKMVGSSEVRKKGGGGGGKNLYIVVPGTIEP